MALGTIRANSGGKESPHEPLA
ncbi:MAG: hypothetical protein QOF87_3001, partial [Pseudonocardiales bacterium]|nr:hypothetical protein [Pseudonocardiales bacterium]